MEPFCIPNAGGIDPAGNTLERQTKGYFMSCSQNGRRLLPLQFSHCLVIVNGAAARLSLANLFQTLMSFDRAVDARIEFQFGLFANNACRRRDGLDKKALGL